MFNKLIVLIVLCLSVVSGAQTEGNRLAGLQRKDGFIPFYWDAKKGTLLFELSPQRMKEELIYFTGLSSGVGSMQMFADRSTTGRSQLCRLVRSGPKVLVIAENTGFRAEHGSPELKHSVERSFPTSVIAALPIESEKDDTLIVNANPLVLRDVTGLLDQLRRPSRAINGMVRQVEGGGSNWRLDEQRSTIDIDHTLGFPRNTEIENTLTFTSDAGSRQMNAPESGVLTVHEHISLLPLPPPGYQPRAGDARVGFFGLGFLDFSQSYKDPLNRRYIARWRLEKKDPAAAISEPVQPIAFYLDQAIPEPIRSAARQGALWWNQAFEHAGFHNALVILDLPEGANPLDMRYPTIQWTNRDGRGWSVGMEQNDPRTGEILHAVVQLDSHRVRTVNNYWNVLRQGTGHDDSALDVFAGLDDADPRLTEEEVMLKRIALLTCHEMGHVLGLEHNFAASTFNRGSVMDYFAPRIAIRRDGTADMNDAYMQGVGSYDRFAIEWGYSARNATDDTQEQARLEAIVQKALRQGIFWGNEEDPRWNAYDDGPDPVTWLKQVLPVRDALLKSYSSQMLRKGEPASNLAARFALVYLFHRYALASAIHVVGGAKIPPSLAGDGQKPLEVWDPARQREALRLVMQSLNPEELEISPAIWRSLVQHENQGLSPESYRSSAGYVFSPYDGARSIAEIVFDGLLDAQRLERLNSIHHFGPSAPAAAEIISALVQNAFPPGPGKAGNGELRSVVQNELADRLMILAADDNAPPEVITDAWAGVEQIHAKVRAEHTATSINLNRKIELFLHDPKKNVPRRSTSGAPAGPPI
ncbi:MAG TPA: zinc-dependent metalloprotease [Candidatus Saccharimonadales bacterium]|nr:zinc-dependent metalloprotease [Candidatus Saccharimonadales bacterium]